MVTKQRRARVTTFIARGELSARAHLTNAQVMEMRQRYANRTVVKVTMAQLAAEYGVSTMQVKRILHRVQWAHLP